MTDLVLCLGNCVRSGRRGLRPLGGGGLLGGKWWGGHRCEDVLVKWSIIEITEESGNPGSSPRLQLKFR